MDSVRFSSLLDLARLPYFEVQNGRLVTVDDTIGPVVDVHAHFALTFIRKPTIDLLKETPEVEHYLPTHRPLDLDVYANRNLTSEDLKKLKYDLSLGSLGATGMRATHTAPNLAREMRAIGISHSCILPIDLPVLSQNAESKLKAVQGRPEFIGFGCVHPYAPHVEAKLDQQLALGARGVKLHPTAQLTHPSSKKAMALYKLCAARKLPILWHCGPVDIEPWLGRQLSQVKLYEPAMEKNPDTTFILGHSGALQFETALELAKRYPNAWLEVSCQGLKGLRRILDTFDTSRIMFGTDWPFYHQGFGLAKVLLATEDRKEIRRKILYENAARLFGLPLAL